MTTITTPTLFTTTHSRHLALQTRNPLASHSFIYSVTTTKIYCRPTCPSRLARRANIRFHDSAAEARAAGFRACKRCRPDDEEEVDRQVLMIRRVCGLIDGEGRKGKLSVKVLAREAGLTESHFCRVFKKVVGVSVGGYRDAALGRGMGGKRGQGVSVEDLGCVDVEERSEDIRELTMMTRGDSLVPWDLSHTSHTLNESIDFEISNFPGECGNDPFDLSTMESRMRIQSPEDCFEFLDFGSPPPVALLI